MRVFIVALGPGELGPEALTKHGLAPGDKIIFLSPSPGEGEALKALKRLNFLLEILGPKITLKHFKIPTGRFEEACGLLVEILALEAKGEVFANLSLAPKIFALEVLAAILLSNLPSVHVELAPGLETRLKGLIRLKYKDLRLLRALDARGSALTGASAKAGLALSTAHRVMARLEGLGLVETWKEGRERKLKLTPLGEALSF